VALLTIPVSFFCAGLSALEGARIHGLVPVLTGVASKDLMLDLLVEQRVAYLYGIESLLLQLANLARERGLSDRMGQHLKGIQSVGISPQLLQAAREVFHAPVFEVYGCTQAAARVANTCELGVGQGSNHFHDEHLFIETRDPATGDLVEEGDAELIISTPYRQASPVIRFAMRDKLTLVPPGACACHARMPGFVPGSLGRLDSMLKIRGVNLWPQQVEQLVLGCPGVEDFRAEVSRADDGADELLIRIAAIQGASSEGLPERIQHLVREQTMVRPRVVLDSALGDTTGAYKVRRWSDRRRSSP
jgi:phenylacetate-CoA ligase